MISQQGQKVLRGVRADATQELRRAEAMYPIWPSNVVIAWATVSEECGEVTKAVNNYYHGHKGGTMEDIMHEIVQLQAMINRFLINLDEYNHEKTTDETS